MERVAPSTRLKQEVEQLLSRGVRPATDDPAGQLVRLAARLILQEALEAEQADFIGRERYQRGEQPRQGYRNGYEPAELKTAEGSLAVSLPQVRGLAEPYQSRLLSLLGAKTEVLEKLAVELYARGLSTRDVEAAFTAATGECLLSKSAVSELTEELWEEYEAFGQRDLSGHPVQYLFVDAIYESLRRKVGAKEAVLCAWAILTDGRKVLLHLALGNKESYEAWLSFFRNMQNRGLVVPVAVTSDGAPGLIQAISQSFPQSVRIRCWFHKMQNVLGKLPENAKDEVAAHLRAVRDAPTLLAGEEAAAQLLKQYGSKYPSAVACLNDDLAASLGHLRLPEGHRIHCRTTNLVERGFVEERRRTKVIPRFLDERSCLKLVFGTLIRAAQRWTRVRMTEMQLAQIEQLRRELGQEPPPSRDQERLKIAA